MKTSYQISGARVSKLPLSPENQTSSTRALPRMVQLFSQLVNWMTPAQPRKVMVVGSGLIATKLFKHFTSGNALGYQFLGFFDQAQPGNPYEKYVVGNLDEIAAFCENNEVDEIYYAYPEAKPELMAQLQAIADKNFIYLRIAASPKSVSRNAAYYYGSIPVMKSRKEPLASRFNQGVKRAFDIVFSLAVLSILVPFVFPIIALAIYLEDPGPIFFVQKRPGKKNKLFNCFKFRSMRVNNDGEKQASKNDSRITKVGAFIRKTSLDELPQFINVLLGDMSVVGPRPNMVKQLEYYSQHIDNYSFRHFVTPGITGYAQIKGFRGETKTIDLMEKRVELDIQYMEKWSLWFDIKIIFLTAYNMVVGEENAY